MSINPPLRRMNGLTMVELIMFIVVVSVGIAGILMVFNVAVKGSADPMQRKQAIAIAEALLTEIEQHPFTYCDPQDANVLTATAGNQCANDEDKGGAALIAPTPAGETRYSLSTPFNNVADYGGFTKSNIDDISGNNAMSGYSASVTITRAGNGLPQSPSAVPDGAALRIQVTITYNSGRDSVTLTGYRLRYAPNSAG
ncbi:type II secretion system protein [Herbaspirillum sp. ST 5-3]|uniref:type IV pilus modification PilV family protein n=1 Tax=Oxalobacteraceae TaxID=75682 RepID=UPI0010A3D763|nr:type II secretion system protein [Herbaspirillum sp. ST 5-3]